MRSALRIVLKVAWTAVLVLLLALYARGTVDFVYTGF